MPQPGSAGQSSAAGGPEFLGPKGLSGEPQEVETSRAYGADSVNSDSESRSYTPTDSDTSSDLDKFRTDGNGNGFRTDNSAPSVEEKTYETKFPVDSLDVQNSQANFESPIPTPETSTPYPTEMDTLSPHNPVNPSEPSQSEAY